MKFYIHKEGITSILIVLIFIILLNILVFKWLNIHQYFKAIILGLSLVFVIFIISFFRVPIRKLTYNDSQIISPADGKVVVIEKVICKEYNLGECWQISVFMSPFNVHRNLSPITGKLVYSKYFPGKYLVAWHPKSSELNERWSIVLQNASGKVLCKQIAGAVARRIVNYGIVGEELQQNQEYGFIKFGSRVDVLIPITCKILVELNEPVKGGVTALAQFN
ncbi:MAG: phosphatidylserine decarboxylase family protein [Alphaproteobacteria bacterium]|nr:phosphatidylserine decarboxylase family protein [Alphaproteobacteria bacterium]